jgi:uncharacterized protein (DUF305 family)
MPHRSAGAAALLLALGCGSAAGPPAGGARLTPAAVARADGGRPAYTRADAHFMSGMIGHHAQAIRMAGWAPDHGASPSVQALAARIVVAQRDEIALMQRWLGDRGEPVPPADPAGHQMPGMDHLELMPGMLTPAEMAELDRARGPEFDRLFLSYMIRHHEGALTMVRELFAAAGAAQDETVFKFASDANVDQTTEIARMQLMLDALGGKPSAR